MADRRMIHRNVVCSDRFLELSYEAMALYTQLTIEGDAYGFIGSPKKVLRAINVQPKVLDELIEAGFVIRFDSGVVVMRHWDVANTRKNDRVDKQHFPAEYAQLRKDENGAYLKLEPTGIQPLPEGSIRNETESQRSLAEPSVTQRSLSEQSEDEIIVSGEGARGGTMFTINNIPPPEDPIVYKDAQTSKEYTLHEYISAHSCEHWKITEATWKIVGEFRGRMEDSLIRFAFDQTCEHAPENPNGYFRNVLRDYRIKGFHTEQEAIAFESKHSKSMAANNP